LIRIKDEHREKIHQWLAAPDPSSNHVNALGKRRAPTGLWFIGGSKFGDWEKSPNSFLWLYGIPGCGKTVLTSTTIEAVLEHCNLSVGTAPNPPPTWAVVYFYFDFSHTQKRNHEKMIRSLIKQLSQQLQHTSEQLESLFSACTNGNRQPTIEALRSSLKQMIEEFNQVFIILDALDECDDREDLMESINEITGWNLQTLHVLTTSRMEREIADGLNVTEEQKLYIQSDLIEADIRAYIYARLQIDEKLRRWQKNKQDQETIVDTLMEKSDGM
jgi:Cdc6-like AAA superfamily ATPase